MISERVNSSSSSVRHGAILAFGAILISFSPVFVKYLNADGMGATGIAFWRMSFGAALYFGLALAMGGSLVLSRRRLVFACLAGFFFACDLSMWHRSIFIVGAGMATILGNTQVFWTATLGHFLYRERLSWAFKAAAPLAIVGIILLAGAGSGAPLTAVSLYGLLLGLGTGVAYALYLISLKSSTDDDTQADSSGPQPRPLLKAIATLAWVSFFGAAFLGVAGFFEGAELAPPGMNSVILLAGLALVAQFGGWLAIYSSLAHLPASQSGLIILLQPTFSMLWGQALFGETLALLQILGACLTLTAIYLGGARELKKPSGPIS